MSVRKITSHRQARSNLKPAAEPHDFSLDEAVQPASSTSSREALAADLALRGPVISVSPQAQPATGLLSAGMYAGITAEERFCNGSTPLLLDAFSLAHLLEDIPRILAAVGGLQRGGESPSLPADGAGPPSVIPGADQMKHQGQEGDDGDGGSGGSA